jgi:hypothetical protein
MDIVVAHAERGKMDIRRSGVASGEKVMFAISAILEIKAFVQ